VVAIARGTAACALLLLQALAAGLLGGCETLPSQASPPAPAPAPVAVPGDLPPPAPREFRAAWVVTVSNIDWPSKPGLGAEAQRAEATALLDRARALGLNALILQVRPAGDALYASALEPWSEALSGEQGRAPVPAWDPLAWWVQEAHARGLELHAWFNPYRARPSTARSPLAAPHLALRQPALARRYGDQLWFDPGEPAAAAQLLAVVSDVLRRYDVDGVQIDDYFYPYPVAANGADLPFPDDESYARYRQGGGALAREDWRRANVDALVEALYRGVHAIKPWVRFGISPFGIGRPERRPAGINGFSQYDKLHADVEHWLESGWLDYLAPQLYWPIDRAGQAFPALLDYWIGQNPAGRHLWPGLYTSQIGRHDASPAAGGRVWPASELRDQVLLLRSRAEAGGAAAAASGHIHFSIAALMNNRDGIATLLQSGPYAEPALVPASPWLADPAPPRPPVLRRNGAWVAIEPGPGAAAARWAVWQRRGGTWRFSVLPAAERQIDAGGDDALALATVDRIGTLGELILLRWP
jgi:uncharacterized lipoprotein YddW (UPF0748 family)